MTTNTDRQRAGRRPLKAIDLLKDIRFVKFANNETVALINANPTAIRLSATSIADNSAPITTVGTLSGTDPDGDSLTFSLVSNAGGLFTSQNGNSVVLSRALDFETAGQHIISVKARGGLRRGVRPDRSTDHRSKRRRNDAVYHSMAPRGNDDRSGEAGQ